jgi:hypothetical protein
MIWRRKLLDFCGSAAGAAAALTVFSAEGEDVLSVELMRLILDV